MLFFFCFCMGEVPSSAICQSSWLVLTPRVPRVAHFGAEATSVPWTKKAGLKILLKRTNPRQVRVEAGSPPCTSGVPIRLLRAGGRSMEAGVESWGALLCPAVCLEVP